MLNTSSSTKIIYSQEEEFISSPAPRLIVQEQPALLTTEDTTTWTNSFTESPGFSVTACHKPRPNSHLYAPGVEIMKNGGEAL